MGYREYARYLSFHFPFTHERSLLEHVRAAPWRYDQSLFKVCAAPAAPCPELVRACLVTHAQACQAAHAARASWLPLQVPPEVCLLRPLTQAGVYQHLELYIL